MYYFDPLYLGLMLVALVIGGGAQLAVKSAFSRWSRVRASCGMTGAQAARVMLDREGLQAVRIERVGGHLSDHYDPRHKVLRLSPDVHDSGSVAALGVACHEAGHAIQDAQKYAPLVVRNAIVPVASFGSNMAMVFIMIGFVLLAMGMIIGKSVMLIGIVAFAAVVLFQVVNLPVEFDASRRAKNDLLDIGLVRSGQEAAGVSSVLNAAAMTYVAATVVAILQLLYFLYRAGLLGGRRD